MGISEFRGDASNDPQKKAAKAMRSEMQPQMRERLAVAAEITQGVITVIFSAAEVYCISKDAPAPILMLMGGIGTISATSVVVFEKVRRKWRKERKKENEELRRLLEGPTN